MAVIGVLFTSLYSMKILYFIFFKDNFNYYINSNILKNYSFNYFNFIPLIILAVLSIFIGYFTKVIFMGMGNNIFYGTILILMKDDNISSEFIRFFVKFIPFYTIFSSFFIFYDINYNSGSSVFNHPYFFYTRDFLLFFNKRMFFDSLLNLFIGFFFFKLSFKIFFIFDKGILEIFGPFGILNIFNRIKNNLYLNFSSGYLFNILLYIFFIVLLLLLVYIYIFLYF